jgi:hypothetical protein
MFFVLPTTSWLNMFFEVQEFTDDTAYKINVVVGILINTVLTFMSEKLIAINLTKYFDGRDHSRKLKLMDQKMEDLKHS